MQHAKLMTGVMGCWGAAFIYDVINRLTGYEPRVLLYVGLMSMAAGLYFGLYANNNETQREEA